MGGVLTGRCRLEPGGGRWHLDGSQVMLASVLAHRAGAWLWSCSVDCELLPLQLPHAWLHTGVAGSAKACCFPARPLSKRCGGCGHSGVRGTRDLQI